MLTCFSILLNPINLLDFEFIFSFCLVSFSCVHQFLCFHHFTAHSFLSAVSFRFLLPPLQKALEHFSWIDPQTRAVFVEFTVLNVPTGFLSRVAMLQTSAEGQLSTDLFVQVSGLYRYEMIRRRENGDCSFNSF